MEEISDAEPVERRTLAKRKSGAPPVTETQSSRQAEDGLTRLREAAARDRTLRFNNLMHHLNIEKLRRAYFALNRKAARGVDNESWQDYGNNLDTRLTQLHTRIHSGRYRPQPVRRVWIPKADGRQRPLGVTSVEDKIVQQALVWVLESIYEVDFKGFSYGFRPRRSQHNALDALYVAITQEYMGTGYLLLTRFLPSGKSQLSDM